MCKPRINHLRFAAAHLNHALHFFSAFIFMHDLGALIGEGRASELTERRGFLKRQQLGLKPQNLLILSQHVFIGVANAQCQKPQKASHELRGGKCIGFKHLDEIISGEHSGLSRADSDTSGRMGLAINEADVPNDVPRLGQAMHQIPAILVVADRDFCLTTDHQHQMAIIGAAFLRELVTQLEASHGHQRCDALGDSLRHTLKCRATAQQLSDLLNLWIGEHSLMLLAK